MCDLDKEIWKDSALVPPTYDLTNRASIDILNRLLRTRESIMSNPIKSRFCFIAHYVKTSRIAAQMPVMLRLCAQPKKPTLKTLSNKNGHRR